MLYELKALDLAENSLVNLKEMPALPSLISLDLSYNEKLESLADLPILPKLKSIDLHRTKINKVERLAIFPELKSIFVHKGQIDLSSIPAGLMSSIKER